MYKTVRNYHILSDLKMTSKKVTHQCGKGTSHGVERIEKALERKEELKEKELKGDFSPIEIPKKSINHKLNDDDIDFIIINDFYISE